MTDNIFLVTTRVEDGQMYLDVTVEDSGGVGLQVGPFGSADDGTTRRWVERIERCLLINWREWRKVIIEADVMQFDRAVENLVRQSMAVDDSLEMHDLWLQHHPLPVPRMRISEAFQRKMDSLLNGGRTDE